MALCRRRSRAAAPLHSGTPMPWRFVGSILAVCALTTAAAADPDAQATAPRSYDWRWRAEALAAGTAATDASQTTAGALASATGQVVLATADCDAIDAGGRVTARSDLRVVSFEQWASICFGSRVSFLSFDHRFAWDVAPRLLAPPRLRRGLQRRETVTLSFGYDIKEGAIPALGRYFGRLGTARLEGEHGWATDDARGDTSLLIGIEFVRGRRSYGDGGPPVELLLLGFAGVVDPTGERDPSDVIDLADLSGLRWLGFRLGAHLGFRSPPGRVSAITEVSASVERDIAAFTVRVAADRRASLAPDGRILIDNRASTTVAVDHRRVRAHLELSAARTRWLTATDSGTVPTGGLATEAAFAVTDHIDLFVRLETGLSVYAPAATLDDSVFATEAMLGLAIRSPVDEPPHRRHAVAERHVAAVAGMERLR
jgi:hypothetical protein